jgi:hypothetical protein
LLLCQERLVLEGRVDGSGELSFEAADGLASALSFGLFAVEVGAGGRVDAGLGDRDSVEGAVELAVAAAVEPVAAVFTGAGFQRRDASVVGELRIALEAFDRAYLAEQLGGAERPLAGQCEQRGRGVLDPRVELAVELEDGAGEVAAAADELARDPYLHRLLGATKATGNTVEPDGAVERARRDRQLRVEVVEVPAQPLLRASALVDEVVAMIDEQLQLSHRWLTWPRMIEPGLAQRRSGDRERVDRVRLSARAAAPPLRCHQLRRHTHQPLAHSEQLALERASQLPAVLNRPEPLRRQRRRPGDKLTCRADRQLCDRAPDLINRNRRQRLLVDVHTNHDHADRLLQRWGDRRADRPQSRQQPRSYQVTLGGLGKAAATQRWQVNLRGDMRE